MNETRTEAEVRKARLEGIIYWIEKAKALLEPYGFNGVAEANRALSQAAHLTKWDIRLIEFEIKTNKAAETA